MADDPVAAGQALWEVVGGAGRGGILVRSAKDTSSPQLPQRLATGSLVRAAGDGLGGRLCYELVSGEGPASGWVSMSAQGRELLVRSAKRPPAAATGPGGPPSAASTAACSPEELEAALPALRWYAEQLEQSRSTAHQLKARPQQPAAAVNPATEPAPGPAADAAEDMRIAGPSADALMIPVGQSGSMMKALPLRQPLKPSSQEDCTTATGCQSSGLPADPHLAKVPLPGQRQVRGRPPCHPRSPTDVLAGKVKDLVTPGTDSDRTHSYSESSLGSGEEARQPSEAWSPDEEQRPRCSSCRLPLGDWGYLGGDGRGEPVHGECRAQLLLDLARADDSAREAKDAALKEAHRRDHGIGWEAGQVPANGPLARELKCCEAASGLCCVVLDEPSHTVRVVPTIDAATCVNLEYLSLALQVRRREGREPLFSLDPVLDGADGPPDQPRGVMQRKRFEPPWLSGTSVGDVMFQADYHLKELSMGEHGQPVVGMRSCFDLAEEDMMKKDWCAREWFVVKQAGIYLSDGNVLTPHVKMGVEAREQVRGPRGMEDVRLTRRDHPLVRYADAFTRNFDLIAERKSVIYHLRELAKASVLAKYLVDDKVRLEESWFEHAPAARDAGPAQVPQLWNERSHSKIRLRDGKLVDAEGGISTSTHGVYGGVAFQLEQVPTMQAARLPRAGATVTARQLALAGGGKARSFGEVAGAPKGVDLNLDGFDLGAPVPLPPGPAGHGAAPLLPEGSAAYGRSFWFSLSCNSGSAFSREDRRFFRALFNPCLSDRHKDGLLFAPPQTSFGYVQGLRSLVQKEEGVQEERVKHFLSKQFLQDQAGSLFPGSWDSSIAIARERAKQASASASAPAALGDGWVPSGAAAANLRLMLKSATPAFDRRAEDGTRFRIYRVGSLEVRTTQAHDGAEEIGVVFSSVAADPRARAAQKEQSARADERVVKVTEFVEAAGVAARPPDAAEGGLLPAAHYFAVATTEAGGAAVTEIRPDGKVAWVANPEGLEERCVRARVTGCSEARGTCVCLGDLQAPREEGPRDATPGAGAGDAGLGHTRRCLELALPAAGKRWGALAASQRRAAAGLGVRAAEGWDSRTAAVWHQSWWDLTEQQRSAARTLGLDDDSWDEAARVVPGHPSKVEREVQEASCTAGAAALNPQGRSSVC